MQVHADQVTLLGTCIGSHLHFHVLHLRAPPRSILRLPRFTLLKRVPPGYAPYTTVKAPAEFRPEGRFGDDP
nr:hypothetical protein GCM10020063_076610 [Dactylosporangium thailandense]